MPWFVRGSFLRKRVLMAHDPGFSGAFPLLKAIAFFSIASGCPAVVMSTSPSTASDTTAPNGFVL